MKENFIDHIHVFKKIFGLEIRKESPLTLEYRVRGDLDMHKQIANNIIKTHNLSLQVVSKGNMSQLNSFEVIAV